MTTFRIEWTNQIEWPALVLVVTCIVIAILASIWLLRSSSNTFVKVATVVLSALMVAALPVGLHMEAADSLSPVHEQVEQELQDQYHYREVLARNIEMPLPSAVVEYTDTTGKRHLCTYHVSDDRTLSKRAFFSRHSATITVNGCTVMK